MGPIEPFSLLQRRSMKINYVTHIFNKLILKSNEILIVMVKLNYWKFSYINVFYFIEVKVFNNCPTQYVTRFIVQTHL